MNMKTGKYQHYKGGAYQVLFVGKGQFHKEYDMEDMVVYQSDTDGSYWVRPLSEFNEEVENNGEKVSRFTFLGE